MKNTTVDLWKNVHSIKSWNDNPYPTANALAFYRYHVSPMMEQNNGRLKILDVGCGTGANTIFFSENGCEAHGCDVSKDALLEAETRVKEYSVNFTECSFTNLNYDDNGFDVVFCDGVLYYGSEKSFEDGIHEMYRVLKKNGVLRVYTKSNNDVWADSKNKTLDDTYQVEKGYEKGMTVYCPPLNKLKDLFYMFDSITIGVEEFNYVGLKNLKSFWVITAIK
jgi:ubiquinone/menaquinone biosynthesis C-methylase UbiE